MLPLLSIFPPLLLNNPKKYTMEIIPKFVEIITNFGLYDYDRYTEQNDNYIEDRYRY